jgi:hypothetical protein
MVPYQEEERQVQWGASHLSTIQVRFLPALRDVGNGIALGIYCVFSIHKCSVLTVSISLNQQLAIQAKSYFWTKFFLQPYETIKTLK